MVTRNETLRAAFRALGDANRLRIVAALAPRPACVCELAYALKLTQPNLSRHLGVLVRAGLVASRRRGPWTEYRLANRAAFAPLVRMITRTAADDKQLEADARALAGADRRRLCGSGFPKSVPRGK